MVGSVPSSRADAGGQLLRELEALSQALYKAKTGSSRDHHSLQQEGVGATERPLLTWHSQGFEGSSLPDFLGLTSSSSTKEESTKQQQQQQIPRKKKGSLWDWKPLRALAHIGQTRFDCEFAAHVHGISKLPTSLEGLRLQVRLKHKESEVRTVPSLVFKGSADFEESLRIRCSVYGSSTSAGGIRYMSKTFTLSVVAPDASELELGKHRLDLSSILPHESGKPANHSWNYSFKLAGRAKGGVLVITFGYEMMGVESSGGGGAAGGSSRDRGGTKFYYPQSPDAHGSSLRSFSSLPSSPQAVIAARKGGVAVSPAQSEPEMLSEYSINIEHLNLDDADEDEGHVEENSPEATTMTMSHATSMSSGLLAPDTPGRQREDELKGFSLEQSDEIVRDEDEDEDADDDSGGGDFSVIEQGVEESKKQEEIEMAKERKIEHPEAEEISEAGIVVEDLDEEAEMVAGEFLHMLGPSSDSEEVDSISDYSPRGLLLKQFEQEQVVMLRNAGPFSMMIDNNIININNEGGGGGVLNQNLNLNLNPGSWQGDDDLSDFMDAAESELQKATQAMKSKARAKMLEDAEAEALMQEWGLNEKAFQSSPPPPKPTDWSSSSIDPSSALILMPEPPILAEGLGSMIPTRDGGSLRSMNPIHFQGGRNDGRLVLQVSKPIVVPAEMGSGVLDIFRSLAAGGAENMAIQVMEAMPLEDITGKNIYQIAMEGQASIEISSSGNSNRRFALGGGESYAALEYGGKNKNKNKNNMELGSSSSIKSGALFDQRQRSSRRGAAASDDTYMSLEDLAPVAMEKIEELAMQGLKIQSDMADEEAPYAVDPVTNLLEAGGTGSSRLSLIEACSSSSSGSGSAESGGLMAMSISLDEWMRLDAGVYDESESSDKTKAVLAAHHAAHSTDIVLLANEDGSSRSSKGTSIGSSSGAGSGSGSGSSGLMGDSLTLAMLVQLRDPLRNFEPVGAPMMAFVQAERVIVPPRPKMWKRVSMQGNSEIDDDEEQQQQQQQEESQFKITGVHMAGLKSSSDGLQQDKKKIWGTQKQQQSGSRWLLAHGMGKTGAPKHPLLKSKNVGAPISAAASANSATAAPPVAPPAKNSSNSNKQGESLWSISSRMSKSATSSAAASGSNKMGGITRNPDVKFGSRLSLGKKKW